MAELVGLESWIRMGLELGALAAASLVGGSMAVRRLRKALAEDNPHALTDSLARDLRASTPDPDAGEPIAKTSGEQIMQAFARSVGFEVERRLAPIRTAVAALRREVNELSAAGSEARARQNEHSRRLDDVEDAVSGPITLELELDDVGEP